MAVDTMDEAPTFAEILADSCTPWWARDFVLGTRRADPVDVLNVLEVLTAAAHAELLRMVTA